jgi:TonB-dependent SusC/RagA subfamily outer membrane receptor
MENVLTYIVQVNILLSIIYLGYVFLLRGLTFYQLNRIYFIVGAIYALIYPFLDIKGWLREEVSMPVMDLWGYIPYEVVEEKSISVFTLENILLGVIGMGVVMLFLKFVFQIASLLRIHYFSNPALWKDYLYRNVVFPIVPFSFFNKIYIHKKQHQEPELHDIFKHEDIHVKGLHTLDILLFEMVLIGSWYNPFVWLMRKAVRQNLEFLTDQQVLNKGVDRQTYQYSLLHVSKQGVAVGISNQFNFKTLKKRIMMMNKKRSSKLELSKYAFLLPIVIFTAGAFTVDKTEAKIEEVVQTAKKTDLQVVFQPDSVLSVKMSGEAGEVLKDVFGSDTIDIRVEGEAYGKVISKDARKISSDSLTKGIPENALIIIDGVESDQVNLKKLAPERIESITVLKDKSAEAAYGAKGKNGVILVTTKTLKTTISYQSTKELKSRAEIDQSKSYLYLYDNNVITKGDFLALPESEVNSILLLDKQAASTLYKAKYPEVERLDGAVRAVSAEQDRINKSKKPLYVIDGKILEPGSFELNNLNPDDIKSIDVLKDGSATSLYGEKGKDGVIQIKMKTGSNVDSTHNLTFRKNSEVVVRGYGIKDSSAVTLKGEVTGLEIKGGDKGALTTLRLRSAQGSSAMPPLVFLDGKEWQGDLNTISTDSIKSFTVLKNDGAVEKYGERAKDGVVEIISKGK